jgi:Kef-type K+ transport system membrane component KefB
VLVCQLIAWMVVIRLTVRVTQSTLNESARSSRLALIALSAMILVVCALYALLPGSNRQGRVFVASVPAVLVFAFIWLIGG